MEKRATLPLMRAKVWLNPEQRTVLNEYLTRTTLLWNLLHQHLKDDAEEYLCLPPGPESDRNFRWTGHKLFTKITASDVSYENTGLLSAWVNYIASIRELPVELIQNRVKDIIDAYEMAKRDQNSGTEKPTGPPRRKTSKSSQSVRFPPEAFTLEKGKIKISSVFPFEFDVPEFSEEVLTEPHELSITRRRLAEQSEITFGPADENEQIFVVTLRPVDVQ